MAPPKVNENMKQKSLMSWLGKPQPRPPKLAPNSVVASAKSADSLAFRTEEQKSPSMRVFTMASTLSSQSSMADSSVNDTPPTSDPVDISMLHESEDETDVVSKPKARTKRKLVIDDSDDEGVAGSPSTHKMTSSSKATASEHRKSPSPTRGRTKKARPSVLLSDEDANDEEVVSSFSSQLIKFKKSPAKSVKSQSSSLVDDDEIRVPSDSEYTARHRSSSRASTHSTASQRSKSSYSSDGENVEEGSKKNNARRSSLKKTATGSSSGFGSGLFLTAAEQRAQEKKTEKKAAEDTFSFLEDIKDKDGVRPGEPGYDPRTLFIPKKAWKEFTPFEKQFWEIKQNHFDTILFFQKGKFLELYEEDARIGHRDFDLKLTQRVKMSMVGVPESSFDFWAAKFLGKGYKVGRVDQVETALGAEMRVAAEKTKGKIAEDKEKNKIVQRELNKVYTNGTLVDEALLTDEQAGHCIAIRESSSDSGKTSSFGICMLDSATSQFDLSAFDDDVCKTKLETLIRQLRPKEVLFTKGNLTVTTTRLLKAILPSGCLWTSLRDVEGFDYHQTLKELNDMFAKRGEDEFMNDLDTLSDAVPEGIREMAGCKDAIEALGAMMWYLRQLNIDKDLLSMKNFNVYDPMTRGSSLVLDGQTLAHIEVFLNNEGTEEGTLHKLLSKCVTPFGKRLFRIWLCVPLREVSDINARLDAVQDLMDHPIFEAEFHEVAKGLPDLERIVSRIHAKNCKVKDFVKVLSAFRKLNNGLAKLADSSESFKSKRILGLLRSAPDLAPNIKNVAARFRQDPETDELLPQEGKDEIYDEIVAEIKELEQELEAELKKFEKKIGCNLTYWHSNIGNKEIYLVQTKPGQKHIPDNWRQSGKTKTAVRWFVPSLQPTVRKLKEADERRNTAVKEFKHRLFAEFDTDRGVWLRAIRVLAELDCIFSLAKSSVALGEPLCRPEFVEGPAAWMEFEELRHPALSGLREDFIPNDVRLGGQVGRIALLTGPNMGGKSTAMRMTATGVIMAQLGMFVPARAARLCPVDSILTRMGAYDNMFSNASTFKVELDECCKILRNATPKSLVVLDELGRGTSTYDGMAIAGAVLHQLATHTLPLAFFATHYGSLTDDFAYHPNIRNMHMATLVDEDKRELVFLYKLVEGVASSSFGTHVANLAGVPQEVVKRAEVVSEDFAKQFKARVEDRQKLSASHKLPLVAQADFVYLLKLACGKENLPEDIYRRNELLRGIKKAVTKCLATGGR